MSDPRLAEATERMHRYVEAEPFKQVWETHSQAAEDMHVVLSAVPGEAVALTDADLEYIYIAAMMVRDHTPPGPSRTRTLEALADLLVLRGYPTDTRDGLLNPTDGAP